MRLLKRLVVFAVLPLVAASGGASVYLRQSLPMVSGTLQVDGLSAPIEIIRDADAIPHIFATNKLDGLYGLGYAHALDLKTAYGSAPQRAGVWYFFPRPSAGSACKRLNLFLRWMVRRDALDLGVWSRVAPAQLIVPLDTHVIRVGRCLRLTRYTSPGWPMARDITSTLRRLDPDDPVRYDFALCHLGMMNACGFGRAQADARCPLRGACRPRVRRRPRSARPSVQR